MNELAALRLMVKHYPGGAEAIASQLGMSTEVLRKQLAGGGEGRFKLGVIDASVISEACISAGSEHCHRYANTIAANSGGFVALAADAAAAASLMGSTVDLVRSSTEVLASVTAARADGQISDNERKDIERVAHGVIASMQSVLREVARENEAGKALKAVS